MLISTNSRIMLDYFYQQMTMFPVPLLLYEFFVFFVFLNFRDIHKVSRLPEYSDYSRTWFDNIFRSPYTWIYTEIMCLRIGFFTFFNNDGDYYFCDGHVLCRKGNSENHIHLNTCCFLVYNCHDDYSWVSFQYFLCVDLAWVWRDWRRHVVIMRKKVGIVILTYITNYMIRCKPNRFLTHL